MKGNKEINLFHNSVFAMNTQLDVVFWGANQSLYENIFRSITSKIKQLELVISCYNTKSNLFRLNKMAYYHPQRVNNELWNAILKAAYYAELTRGFFNVSMGNVYHQLKSGKQIKPTSCSSFSDRIEIDEKNQLLSFKSKDVSIDFGAIGKGMALNLINTILEQNEIKNAFISFGGSSILTRGSHPYGSYWPFQLSDDNHFEWKLNNDYLSISNSNRKENSFHIVDPHTQQAIQTKLTAVVLAQNPVDAEVLSTALIAAPIEDHKKIAQNFNGSKYSIIEPTFYN